MTFVTSVYRQLHFEDWQIGVLHWNVVRDWVPQSSSMARVFRHEFQTYRDNYRASTAMVYSWWWWCYWWHHRLGYHHRASLHAQGARVRKWVILKFRRISFHLLFHIFRRQGHFVHGVENLPLPLLNNCCPATSLGAHEPHVQNLLSSRFQHAV